MISVMCCNAGRKSVVYIKKTQNTLHSNVTGHKIESSFILYKVVFFLMGLSDYIFVSENYMKLNFRHVHL